MPINYKDYPQEWKVISKEIMRRQSDKCGLCYAPNGVYVQRIYGAEYPWYKVVNAKEGDTKIVLTVHHIDCNKENNSRVNLIALCQRCHLRLDLGLHLRNRKAKQHKKQMGFFSSK